MNADAGGVGPVIDDLEMAEWAGNNGPFALFQVDGDRRQSGQGWMGLRFPGKENQQETHRGYCTFHSQ